MDKIFTFLVQNLNYLIIAGCLLLLFLSSLVFRKTYKFSTELKKKEKALKEVEEELKARKTFYNKSFSILSSAENISKNLYNSLLYFFEIFKVEKGIIFYEVVESSVQSCVDYKWNMDICPLIKEYIHKKFEDLKEGIYFNWREYEDVSNIVENYREKKFLILPFFRREKLIGGLFLLRKKDEKTIFDKEVESFFKIIRQMVEFHILQNEIIQRNDEANLILKFLSSTFFIQEAKSIKQRIEDFFKSNFSRLNFSLLVEDKSNFFSVESGILLNHKTIFEILKREEEKLKKDKPFLLIKEKSNLNSENVEILIVPQRENIERKPEYFIFECVDGSPLKLDTINTIVRICEMSSFLINNAKNFDNQLNKFQLEISKLKNELAYVNKLKERVNHINKIFTISRNLKKSLIKLEGFFQLLKNEISEISQLPQVRNIEAELEILKEEMEQFKLLKVLLDENFSLNLESQNFQEFFNNLIENIKKFTLLKKIPIQISHHEVFPEILIDRDLVPFCLNLLFRLILENIFTGEIRVSPTLEEKYLNLKFNFLSKNDRLFNSTDLFLKEVEENFIWEVTKKVLDLSHVKYEHYMEDNCKFYLSLKFKTKSKFNAGI